MKKEISLVLSGGGARGIAHIGVIRVLEENGFIIKNIAGTSMGALVGGVYAAGGLDDFEKWLVEVDIKEMIKMLDFSLHLPGLIKAEKIMRKIDEFLFIKNIEDLPLPYTAIATDLNTSSEVRFTSGSLIDAIRASIAIPTIITPVLNENQILVDGGLVNNIPLNRLPDNRYPVAAVCVNADIALTAQEKEIMNRQTVTQYLTQLNKLKQYLKRYRLGELQDERESIGYAELLDKSIHLMISRASQHLIMNHPPELLINVSRELCGTFDFLKAEKILEIGKLAARRALRTEYNV